MGLFDDVMGYFGREGAAVQARIVTPPSQVSPTPRPTVDPMSGRPLITTAERGGVTYTREQIREPSFRARRKLETVTRRATRRVRTGVESVRERISTGYRVGVGERVDITKMKVPEKVVPFEKYATAPIHKKAAELAATYKEWMGRRGIVEVPTGVAGEVIEPLRRFGTGIVRAPAALVETAGMVPLGVEFVAREPAVAARMAPIGMGIMAGGMVTGMRERPFETAGEFVGMMWGPKVITKVVPAPKIPTMPRIPIRQRIPTVPVGLMPGKIVKFRAGAGIASALKKASPPIKKPLDFTQVKSLGRAGKDVEAWIKAHPEQETVVGGSAAARTQLKGARQPGDIDINVGDVRKAALELHEIVSKVHGKDKTKVSFQPEYGSAKVKVKTNGWHDAVDIHPTTAPGARFGELSPYKVQKPVRIGGIDYIPLGELIQRKAASVLQSRRGGTIGPEEWRLKDVGDFERFVSEALEHKFTKAQTAKMFAEYRKGKVKALEQELIEYQTHVAYGPDPYQVRVAAVKYERLPVTVKLPTAALVTAVSTYPREYKPLGEVTKVPRAYPPYKPPREPVYDAVGGIPYKPVEYKPPYKPPAEPPYKPPYEPAYAPPYKTPPYAPPAYPPYEPPYKPYEPAYVPPPYTPPYEPTKYKLPYLPKDEKKEQLAKKRRARKGFEYYIENPIASIFGNSIGKVK